MQSNIILNRDCAWKSYGGGGMECDLNRFQSIRYENGHVDILYSYDVSFAVQYIYMYMQLVALSAYPLCITCLQGSQPHYTLHSLCMGGGGGGAFVLQCQESWLFILLGANPLFPEWRALPLEYQNVYVNILKGLPSFHSLYRWSFTF